MWKYNVGSRNRPAVTGEKMLENVEGMARLWLLPGNWIYNFAPSFKCPLLSDKSCLPIIRRHVNSSLARSLAHSSSFSMETLGPTMRLASDIDLHKRRRAILHLNPLYSASRCPSPPRRPLTPPPTPFENCGEINSFLFPCLFVQFPRRYYSKGFFLFVFFLPLFELEKHRCRAQMSIFAHSRPS